MTTPAEYRQLDAQKADLAYHQMRVLMLVAAVSATEGHSRKLDGLTKLAKLDFLVRYIGLASHVLDGLRANDSRLHVQSESELTDVEAPMIRYKYGPWDDRYYPVIGALVGRGLLRYVKGRRGSVALAPTARGRKLVEGLASSNEWQDVNERCIAIAEATSGMSGAVLKDLIYERLPELMDRPHRQVIR
jgi:hypothetical protein